MLLVYESDGPSWIGSGQSGTWTGFSLSTSVFACQYLPTNTQDSFIPSLICYQHYTILAIDAIVTQVT